MNYILYFPVLKHDNNTKLVRTVSSVSTFHPGLKSEKAPEWIQGEMWYRNISAVFIISRYEIREKNEV